MQLGQARLEDGDALSDGDEIAVQLKTPIVERGLHDGEQVVDRKMNGNGLFAQLAGDSLYLPNCQASNESVDEASQSGSRGGGDAVGAEPLEVTQLRQRGTDSDERFGFASQTDEDAPVVPVEIVLELGGVVAGRSALLYRPGDESLRLLDVREHALSIASASCVGRRPDIRRRIRLPRFPALAGPAEAR